ncbi:hypothetical protein BCV69DRAFT_294302 [Microstroma glucosiphilum]|uniref:Mak10-domain-containing protein n=1 Tax=Pseudomicrostroma glucosiphilum TaxID=1684307 RepID=A0A316UAI7_9BASI|nr:hypothetical protein BCV69DRAFT_294302 [Pseudomicrostroma glucosiphilum]PWN20045.1 hypothetical protein BCV69DRAFT_294302 [Pseudomicrostroma glucosiphilum]
MSEEGWPPPPQRRVGQQRAQPLFLEATDELRRQCSALAMGQMVHPMTFTLMDSMTCISISDPRMDSGIYPTPQHLIPESDRIPRDDLPRFDPQRPLTVADLVWIMDRLTACEVAFHDSAPLSQTLFTCLLYHSVEEMGGLSGTSTLTSVEEPHEAFTRFVLRAYLVATIKCFGLAWQELIKGNIIDGEDAITDTCNLSLLDDFPVERAIDELEAVIAWVQHIRMRLPREQRPGMEGLLRRLNIRGDILTALTVFSAALSSDKGSLGADPTGKSFSSIYTRLRHLGIQVSEQIGKLTLCDVDLKSAPSLEAASVFDPSYSRRLQNAGGIPPRPVELPSKEAVVKFWQSKTTGWSQAAGIYRMMVMGTGNKWEELTAFTGVMGTLALEQPSSAHFRSLLQSCLCPPPKPQPELLADFWSAFTGKPPYIFTRALLGLEHLLAQPISGRGGSDFSSSSDPIVDAQSVEWWLQKGEGLLANFLLNCMTNHSRARRMIGKSYVEWRQWSSGGATIRDQLATGAIGDSPRAEEVWTVFSGLVKAIEEQTMEMACWLTMSGFDLELYAPEERPIAYWLAMRTSGEVDEKRSSGSCDDAESSWRTKCFALWGTLASLDSSTPKERAERRPHWVLTAAHREATFKRRFKWLRHPTFTPDGERQDPNFELDSLWDGWEKTVELASTEEAKAEARAGLAEQVRQVREAVRARTREIEKDKRWALCRTEAQLLNTRLLSTIETIAAHLGVDDQAQGTGDSGKKEEERKESSLVPHPWFPLILPAPAPA